MNIKLEDDKAVVSFISSLAQDMENINQCLNDRANELQESLKKQDYTRCIEISAEIIAHCGSIVPLQNLIDGIELAMNHDRVN